MGQPKNGETLTKSVRHERHRRVSGPDPVVQNSNGIILKEEQKENKHKPNFERCDDYKPEVLEEEPVGTRVIRVFASDADGSGAGIQGLKIPRLNFDLTSFFLKCYPCKISSY